MYESMAVAIIVSLSESSVCLSVCRCAVGLSESVCICVYIHACEGVDTVKTISFFNHFDMRGSFQTPVFISDICGICCFTIDE